jgi:hypothetical protein
VDIDAEMNEAMSIKAQCEIGTYFAKRMSEPDEDHATHRSRYETRRDECIARIDKMKDEFSRGLAIHQVIKMCMTAGDVGLARALFINVTDDFLRGQILDSAPVLKAASQAGQSIGLLLYFREHCSRAS